MWRDPGVTLLPLTADTFAALQRESLRFQTVLAGCLGEVDFSLPCHKALTSLQAIPLKAIGTVSGAPLPDARTVVAGGAGKSGKAAVAWLRGNAWHRGGQLCEGSAQSAELCASVEPCRSPLQNL